MAGARKGPLRAAGGELGEVLVRHFLLSKDVNVHRVGQENFPFDLIVPAPDGKIFKKKAVIQVKTETTVKKLTNKYYFYPSKFGIQGIEDFLKEHGYEHYEVWIALVWIRWVGNELRFHSCLFPSNILTAGDFLPSKRGLYFWKAWNKAPIRLKSGKP